MEEHTTCRACHGKGCFGPEICALCRGRGVVPTVRRYAPAMPSGEMVEREEGLWVEYGEWEKARRDCDGWKIAEHEARHGNTDCTLCPHLGNGDPLVDAQAEELQWIKERLRVELHNLDSLNPNLTPPYKLSLQRIRHILGGHRCPAQTKEGKPCRNVPMNDDEKVCHEHYAEMQVIEPRPVPDPDCKWCHGSGVTKHSKFGFEEPCWSCTRGRD